MQLPSAGMTRVLIVDDEPMILRALERVLRERIDLVCSANPVEALELLGDSFFAVLVSDLRMPQMNGAEFLRRARVISPRTAQILLTGTLGFAEAVADQRAQIFRCIEKPCPTPLLATAIEQAAATVAVPQ